MAIVAARKAEEPDAPLPGEARASIGHNAAPLEEMIPVEFRVALTEDRPDFLLKLAQVIDAAERMSVTDDESLGKAGEFANLIRACEKHISNTHETVKAPYLLGSRLVDAEKRTFLARLDPVKQKVQFAMNDYMAEREAKRRAEEARIAAEQRAAAEAAEAAARAAQQAEREAELAMLNAANEDERIAAAERAFIAADAAMNAMEAASQAPAQPKRAEPVRSDAGATVSGKTVWNSEVQDYAKAFKMVRSNPKVQEAIAAAVSGLVRAGTREIPGVRIWSTIQATAR